jgi:gliding motility-associated-like protein
VIIEDDEGCILLDTAIVGEPDALVTTLNSNVNYGVDVNGNPYFVSCNGASDGEVIAVISGGTGVGTYDYNWSNGQTVNPAVSLSSGNLTLNITDANGCPATSSIFLTEPNPITDNATLSTNAYGFEVSCFGANDGWISLNPSGGVPESNGAYSYSWSVNSTIDSVADNLYAGIYSVTITDANGCEYPFNYTLTQPSEPFNATVNTVNYAGASHPPVNVIFEDSTTDNSGNPITVNHNWVWSDNGAVEPFINSGFETFSHSFNEIGLNDVYVLVQNQTSGCTDTVYFTIAVQGIPDVNNVFTPNGDGVNDEFMFDEFGINTILIEIYNRWGQKVNNWSDINKGWNGRGVDGQELPEGVYFYVLTAEGEDGHYYNIEGTVTLLR